ncbi:LysR family transcriptional regulator [Chitinivorax sp. PXF-14]|uniref:LysR family transcriptional regulator n=1 Tax=Chitinivorax sp. PXF-14 TaxID=3230488 RepID=UPI00346597BF
MSSSVNLNRLAVFAAVAETGSFTAAADRLDLTKAMVSQHVARLEAELGATLLTRTTRRVTLTENGAAFYADCVRILQEAEAAFERVGHAQQQLRGTLRLTATADFGVQVVGPALAAFVNAHPGLKADFTVSDEVVDLIGERFDLAIRGGMLADSGLYATRLGHFAQVVVATPAYLARYGMPRQPADLAAHRWIALSLLRTPLTWAFAGADGTEQTVRVNAISQANSPTAVRAFVLADTGISVLPDYLVQRDLAEGRLVRLLAGYALPDAGLHAVYPMPNPPAKVRAFIDFLRGRMAADDHPPSSWPDRP